jgi:hypothetical protein
MPIYWEKNAGGVYVENFDIKEEDENCEIQKPQIQSTEDDWMENLYGQHNIDF